VSKANAAFLVADHDKRGESKAPAALYDLGHAIYVHELVNKLTVTIVSISERVPSHFTCPSSA
jgi:hypothetical protein